MRNHLFFFILLPFFWSCSIQTPEETELVLPSAFSDSGTDSAQVEWWNSFADPILNDLIEEALGNNFTLRTAEQRLEQAKAEAVQAGASLLPSVDFEGSTSTIRDYQNEISTESFSLGVAAAYEIDLWGRLRNSKGAALSQMLASKEDVQIAALSVAAEVASAWFSRIESGRQLLLLLKQQEINRKYMEIIEIQVVTGNAQMADLLQQRQLVESNNASITTREAESRAITHRLNVLLGQPPKTAESILGADEELPELPPLPATGLPADLLQRRPDVKSAWLAFKAADQSTAAAIANRLPKLSVSAELTTAGSRSRDLFNNWLTTLAANLFAPIIDGGTLKAEVARQQAIAKQKYFTWSQSILEALEEVENALSEENALKLRLVSLMGQEELARQTVQLVTRRYRRGSGDYQRVLTAILSQQGLQQSILETRLQLLTNRITLYRALSGGLPETSFKPRNNNETELQ